MKMKLVLATTIAAVLAITACGEDRKDERTKPGQKQDQQANPRKSTDADKANKGSKRNPSGEGDASSNTTPSDTPPPVQNPEGKAFCGEFKLSNAASTAERPWSIKILTAKEGDRLEVELDGGTRHIGVFTMPHSKVGNVDNYQYSWQGTEHGELFRIYKYEDGACLAQYKYSGYTEELSLDGSGMISWYAQPN